MKPGFSTLVLQLVAACILNSFAQEPPPADGPRNRDLLSLESADGLRFGPAAMAANAHSVFVVRDGALFQYDMKSLRLVRQRQLSGTEDALPASSSEPVSPELKFIPDAGVRIENAGNPAASVDTAGKVYLFYRRGPQLLLSEADDGLHFKDAPKPDAAAYPFWLRRADGGYRKFMFDREAAAVRSASSGDGKHFTADTGFRYRLHPSDCGMMGVYDVYGDAQGGMTLIYIGDMRGVNNIRRAYASDGWSFSFQDGDVLGDAAAGGGPNSFVDPKSIPLPDGRRRLFVMRQGSIHSFVSADGKTYSKEPGLRLRGGDFTEFEVRAFYDPHVVRLKDGRYRMYVATTIIGAAAAHRDVIVSATTAAVVSQTR